MVEREIIVGAKKFKIRELLAMEIDDIDWDNKKEAVKKQVILSTGISDAEYSVLTVKERISIIVVINELNGLDFQTNSQAETK